MEYITPQNTIMFAMFLIGLSVLYKYIEHRLLREMQKTPELFPVVGKTFRYRYQQLYREQSDVRHIHFFDDEAIISELKKTKPYQATSEKERRTPHEFN